MTAWWKALAARFDALAPRERALVAVAMIAVPGFLFLSLAIDPLLARQKRLTLQLADIRQNIRTAEDLLKVREVQADPNAVRRAYRDGLRNQLADIDRAMQALQDRLVPPERMASLLREMLGAHGGLRLVALRTLPARRFDSPATQTPVGASGPAGAAGAEASQRGIYQHSVELTLEGSYAALHEYLARLERSPLHMFWGRLELDASGHPSLTATLTVHTLSLSKAWLVV